MSWAFVVTLSTGLLGFLALLAYIYITRHIPSRRDRRQRPQAPWGLVEFRRADLGTQLRADGVDVIFVHGLGANPDTTWTATLPNNEPGSKAERANESRRICWVRDLWVNDIPAEVRRKTRVFFYNHDSGWQRDGVQGRLSTLASRLLHELRGMTQIRHGSARGGQVGSNRALVFVTHSYGGLLVKQAFLEASTFGAEGEHVRRQTKGILFLGTPHCGSNFSTLGRLAAWCLGPVGADASMLRELDYDSTNLNDLHTHFTRVVRHDRDDFTQVFNVFEQRPTVLLQCGTLQWAQLVVRESSATYTGNQYVQNIGVAVDHSGLNKFVARTDEGSSTVQKALQDLLSPQLPTIEVRPLRRVPMYTKRRDSVKISEQLWISTDGDGGCDGDGDGEGNGDGFRALVLYGLGGVSKTQLALQYVEEHRRWYNPIIWLDASSVQSLRQSFQDVARALKISGDPNSLDQEEPLSQSPLVSRVREWLADRDEGDSRWLAVVDNADQVDHELKAVMPQGVQGHVIVTSQTLQALQLFHVGLRQLLVESMQGDEARALLMKRMGVDGNDATAEVWQLFDAVADRVGCLALAVDMAGAVLAEEVGRTRDPRGGPVSPGIVQTTLKQYLDDFDAHCDDLLIRDQRDELSEYQKTVWTVWNTSIDAVRIAGRSLALECLDYRVSHSATCNSSDAVTFRCGVNMFGKV